MKVIANIPEEMLQELKDGCFGAKHTLYDLAGAICDGDVLPDNATNGDVIKALFPLIEVQRKQEPRREGHWIDNHNGTISCSSCHTWFHKDDRYSYMHYCPNCKVKIAESEEQ